MVVERARQRERTDLSVPDAEYDGDIMSVRYFDKQRSQKRANNQKMSDWTYCSVNERKEGNSWDMNFL